jgi:GH25 family lysozyme M1 (1,4-beta-N-acetylmuramidase)
MDSKLKRVTILGSMSIILLIAILVLIANTDNTVSGSSTVSTQPSTVVQTNEQVQESGQIGDNLSAFLNDTTFFDQDTNDLLEGALSQSARLSLLVTSVEKDLRIQIVDTQGELVTGQSFYVKLEGLGEYKDLDKDGIIYIGDLDSGEYYVELMPVSGYVVPSNSTKVRVKDKVEYLAIDDISLLIKTEAEIDAEAEDTGIRDALADADKTENSDFKKSGTSVKLGIDVSKWNGDIDWYQASDSGVEFAIVRAGYRGSVTGSIVVDPYFEYNMKQAQNAGVSTGVYFFTQAVNEVEAVEEASAVIELIKQYNIEYPVYIDTEGAGGNGRADSLDSDTRTLVCEAFCRTIENAGYTAGVYASRNWYEKNLDTSRIDKYKIWLAEYRSVPKYEGYYNMWQYSSKGSINGITGKVDLNICYD